MDSHKTNGSTTPPSQADMETTNSNPASDYINPQSGGETSGTDSDSDRSEPESSTSLSSVDTTVSPQQYLCPHPSNYGCLKVFAEADAAEQHARDSHKPYPRFPCPLSDLINCIRTFKTRAGAAKHQEVCHTYFLEHLCPLIEAFVDVCPNKTYSCLKIFRESPQKVTHGNRHCPDEKRNLCKRASKTDRSFCQHAGAEHNSSAKPEYPASSRYTTSQQAEAGSDAHEHITAGVNARQRGKVRQIAKAKFEIKRYSRSRPSDHHQSYGSRTRNAPVCSHCHDLTARGSSQAEMGGMHCRSCSPMISAGVFD